MWQTLIPSNRAYLGSKSRSECGNCHPEEVYIVLTTLHTEWLNFLLLNKYLMITVESLGSTRFGI